MIKKLFIILFLIFTANNVNGGFNVIQPIVPSMYEINLTNGHDDIGDQIIYIFPSQVFSNISYIDGFTFRCGKTNDAVGNYNIRVYTWQPITIISDGLVLQDNFNIPQSSCLDWNHQLTLTLANNIDVSTFSQINNSIAIGIFSTTTTGGLYTFGNPNYFGFYSPNLPNTYGTVFNPFPIPTLFNPVYFNGEYSGLTSQIKTMTHRLTGQYQFPPTPIQPPNPTDTVSGDVPDIGNGTLPDFGGIGNTTYEPDFNNMTECPDCQGNETIIKKGLSTDDSSIGKTMDSLGYCKDGNCDVYDLFDFLYDFGWFLFVMSLIFILYKFIYLEYF